MKHYIFFMFFISFMKVSSQVYLSPDNFVFVNNQFVFIKNELRLENNSNFYLRNQSQLLQGTSTTSANSGLGNLSLFQEGTVNNFQYNYWCSPVGIPSNITGNSNFGISRLNRPTGLISFSPSIILPYNSLDGLSNPLSISQRWIYTFTTSNTYSQWNFIGANNTILPGQGFTMKGTSGTDNLIANIKDGINNNLGSNQRYDFRGKPNDGTITNLVLLDNFTLIGNPYPSSIDLNLFLLDPVNSSLIDGQAYFWEQVAVNSHYIDAYSGGYGVYTPGAGYTPAAFWNYDNNGGYETNLGVSGTFFERRFTPIGQGFMVKGTANGTIYMRNSFRAYRKEGILYNSEFARNENQNETSSEYFEQIPNVAGIDYTQIKKGFAPQLRIHAMYNNVGIRPTTLGFDPLATDGFDYGFDGRSPSSENSEFYFIVENSPYEYVINVTNFDINKKIPIGFRNQFQTNFKIKVVDFLYGFDANQNVYVHDKENDTYHNIKDEIFNITLPAGDNKTRFEITFINPNESLFTPSSPLDLMSIYQSNDNLIIENTQSFNIISVEIYDLTGKLVINKFKLGTETRIKISTINLNQSVYIIRIKTDNGHSIDKKILIK